MAIYTEGGKNKGLNALLSKKIFKSGANLHFFTHLIK
jgi:hypothetical protein